MVFYLIIKVGTRWFSAKGQPLEWTLYPPHVICITYPPFQICLHEGPEIDPDKRDSVSTQELKASLQSFLRTHCPGVDPEVAIEESCIYTLTPDQNPIIDCLPERQNVVFGVGFSGMGFKLGPVTGRMLADLAQVKVMMSIVVI